MMGVSRIMGSSALTMRNLVAHDCLVSNGTSIQCVRWKRKPIWLPTAKSKVFRVPIRPVIPEEDKEELKRLNFNYKTQIKSLMAHFRRAEKSKSKKFDRTILEKAFEEDFLICSKINDDWNQQVAQEREIRRVKEREERKEIIKNKLAMKVIRDKELRTQMDNKIRKLKEDSVTFITKDNVDEAIEYALENITNYDVAIDLNGKTYDDSNPPLQGQDTSRNRVQVNQ